MTSPESSFKRPPLQEIISSSLRIYPRKTRRLEQEGWLYLGSLYISDFEGLGENWTSFMKEALLWAEATLPEEELGELLPPDYQISYACSKSFETLDYLVHPGFAEIIKGYVGYLEGEEAKTFEDLLDEISIVFEKIKVPFFGETVYQLLTEPLGENQENIIGLQNFFKKLGFIKESEVYSPLETEMPAGATALDYYLRDCHAYSFLGHKTEVLLAALMVSPEVFEGRDLEQAQIKAEVAADWLASANMLLVVSIAQRYYILYDQKVPLLDLIQEGNEGLLKAIERFDFTFGNRFSTYATWWIRKRIIRSFKKRLISLPIKKQDQLGQVLKEGRVLKGELGREPTLAEIASRIDLTEEEVRDLQELSRLANLLSLNFPVGEKQDAEFGEFIEDETTPAPDEAVMQALTSERLEDALVALGKLDPRKEAVLRLWCGFTPDGQVYSMGQIGEKFGLTRQRADQIQKAALKALRQMFREREEDY